MVPGVFDHEEDCVDGLRQLIIERAGVEGSEDTIGLLEWAPFWTRASVCRSFGFCRVGIGVKN
jgi:hypothetical protein